MLTTVWYKKDCDTTGTSTGEHNPMSTKGKNKIVADPPTLPSEARNLMNSFNAATEEDDQPDDGHVSDGIP